MKKLVPLCLALLAFTVAGRAAAATDTPPALMGEWELSMMIVDTNRNGKLDPEERDKPTFSQKDAKDYLKLNADGTCLFYTFKNSGRYELRSRVSDGKTEQTLYIIAINKDTKKEEKPENRGRIYSVTPSELILVKFSTGNGVFSVYHRPNKK